MGIKQSISMNNMNKIFKNRKGFQSKTGILLVVLTFYATLFVFIGYINSYMNYVTGVTTTNPNTSGFFSFLGLVIGGISDIPIWLNIIIFSTLITILSWIIFSSLPTINGGS